MSIRVLMAALMLVVACQTVAAVTTYQVKPSTADPDVKDYDSPNDVMFDPRSPADAPLVLFMPGTGGKPGTKADLAMMNLVVGQGYRVIWLTSNNTPSVSEVCPHDPDAHCSEAFRRMRIYGEGPAPVRNPVAESIVTRLTKLLAWLDVNHPGEGWGGYLVDGKPNWTRFVVGGLSQGAGMAAYIAKEHEVQRVVLFSSPWDDTHASGHKAPAPWLSLATTTPVDRWYAAYNQRENTVDRIVPAYAALNIPKDHILVFDLNLPDGYDASGSNPYHAVNIRDPRYAPQWKILFGSATAGVTPQGSPGDSRPDGWRENAM